MARVLVLFHGRTGDTAILADAIAEGARSVRFTEVDVRRLDHPAPAGALGAEPASRAGRERPGRRHATLDDAGAVADYDALILGGPAGDGVMAAELTRFLDQLGPLGAAGTLVDKVGAVFTSAPTARSGLQPTPMAILVSLGDLGMLLVPPGHAVPAPSAPGSPQGATTTADAAAPSAAVLAAARHHGARVARVAGWVRHAKGHEAADAGGGHHHHH